GSFYQDALDEVLPLGTECEADTKFTRASTYGKHQHTCDANDGDRQRDGCKQSKHKRVQTIRSKHFRTDVFQGSGALDGLISGHSLDHARNRRNQRIWISTGVDKKTAGVEEALFKCAVDGEHGLRNDMLIIYISSNANDTKAGDAVKSA